MRHVILPQMVRLVIPAMGNQYIGLTKNTSVVLVIGVTDVVFQAQQIEAETFRGVEAYTTVIAIFVVICLTESLALRWLSDRTLGRLGSTHLRLGSRRAVALESE